MIDSVGLHRLVERFGVDLLAIAAALVLAWSLPGSSPALIAVAVPAAIGGLVLARLQPSAAVLTPALVLIATAYQVPIESLWGRVLLAVAVGAGLRVPGLDALLAPVLPLGVIAIGLVLDEPAEPAEIVAAAIIALLLTAAISARPAGEPVRVALRERLAVVPTLVVVVPVVILVALLAPRLERGADAPRGGEAGSERRADPSRSHPGFGGPLDVGEPVELGNEIIMRVAADDATFWRVDTYGRFDGRVWVDRAGTEDDLLVPTGAAGERFRQTFTMEHPLAGAVPTAYRPLAVAMVDGSGRLRGDATIEPGGPLRAGERYVVTSIRQPVSAADLRASPDTAATRLTGELAALTEIGTTDRVRQLAAAATAGLTNDYDRVRALEDLIADRVEYTRDITSLPAGADAVDHLLFESHRGFCEQIGTALTVMARSIGIPARLAVGYVPVERDTLQGEWIVRAEHAHAWAEIWFPSGGWQGFDPTASVPLAADARADAGVGMLWWAIGLLAILGACAASVWLVRAHLRRRSSPTPDRWHTDALARLDGLARRHGIVVDDATTLLRLGRQLATVTGFDEVTTVSTLLDRDSFGQLPLDTAERRVVDAILDELDRLPETARSEPASPIVDAE